MPTDRRIERHQLPCFLQVFNRYTGEPIGYLGNVCEEGLMLISQLPLLVKAEFELQLKLPLSDGAQQLIDLTGRCLWCHEETTPGYYDSGFNLLESSPGYPQLVAALQHYFSFHPLEASA
ncbi:PilZ domain-containing protein [Pseudomonas sp. MWU13-2100]|uniref:PilZ domain-containing protein n=1 Tax=Pseudomonas sp. MWU13-2100 TaxID=2935075 RepID=UPI00200FEBAB|nr:PilZ domain-containing protein [Pseudomonas sp. MWU13-2100]